MSLTKSHHALLRTIAVVAALTLGLLTDRALAGDAILDWNSTFRKVAKADGHEPVNMANPGWATRTIALMNGAMYDVFQALHRTHQPLLVDTTASASDTSLRAAVNQAAYDVLVHAYPGQQTLLDGVFNQRMDLLPDNPAKTNGINLGQTIAAAYVGARTGDGSNVMNAYIPGTDPGEWRPDPFHPDQMAWGPDWGGVAPWVIPSTQDFVNQLPPIPALDSAAYADAYNMVKDYGELTSAVRTDEQTRIGLFWGYDHAGLGPPPVLFVRNLEEIAAQTGNTPGENARLFAQAAVAMADAATAAWDAKFTYNFWRPVTAIHDGDLDGNAATLADAAWRPLGAPGPDPLDFEDDFTPPFPAWTSGHATMGGALFKSVELFYGTNSFDAIDGVLGNDPLYTLTSEEPGSGGARDYGTFTQTLPLAIGSEDSPEGENGTSRIYLGIHWIFDQVDGIQLGNDIAEYAAANRFARVPEPSSGALALLGAVLAGWSLRQRRRR